MRGVSDVASSANMPQAVSTPAIRDMSAGHSNAQEESAVVIDVSKLDSAQYFGLACVVDGHAFGPTEHRVRVGFLGDDLHAVHACQTPCAGKVDRLVSELRPKHALRAS
jgi:hypothetical protein